MKLFLNRIMTIMLLVFSTTSLLAQTELQKAIAEIESEKTNQARQILNKLITADPSNPENYYWMGMAYYADEDYTKANEQFNKGIKAKAKYPYNYVGLGRVLLKEKKGKEGELQIQKAIAFNKTNDVNLLYAIGYAYLDGGRTIVIEDKEKNTKKTALDCAEVTFTRAESLDPKNPKSYVALGDMYLKQGVKDLPEKKYKAATELNPKYAEGFYKLGLIKLQEGADFYTKGKKEQGTAIYMEALGYLNKATEADPNFAPAYRERGDGYYQAGNYEKARDEYQKYVKLAQNDMRARTKYASFLYLSANYKEALSEIESCLKDTTTNVLLRLAGYCNYELGNPAKAKDFMDKYFARIGAEYTIAEDFEKMGKIFLALGDKKSGLENYEKCLAKDSSKYTLYQPLVDSAEAARKRAPNEEVKIKMALEEAEYRKIFILAKNKAEKIQNPTDYLRWGFAYYFANDFDNANKVFTEITQFSPKYIAAYYWLAAIASKKDNAEGKIGSAAPYYQKIIDYVGEKTDRLPYENEYLTDAYRYLAISEGKKAGGDFNCEAAKPYITKGLTVSPNDENLKEMSTSCP